MMVKKNLPFIILLAAILFNNLFLGIVMTDGISMEPTIKDGHPVIATHIGYKIKRGDIVIARCDDYTAVAKRVVGMPHDEIEIKNGSVYVNGKKSSYGHGKTKAKKDIHITLKNKEYFLLGDNREHSYDSRDMGPFRRSRIKAKVLHIF